MPTPIISPPRKKNIKFKYSEITPHMAVSLSLLLYSAQVLSLNINETVIRQNNQKRFSHARRCPILQV